MGHRDVALRRKACLTALQTVLDESVVMDALWELEKGFLDDLSDLSDRVNPRMQQAVAALARRYLLDARATQRLVDEILCAFNAEADNLPPDPWPQIQAMHGIRGSVPTLSMPQILITPAPQQPVPQIDQKDNFGAFKLLTYHYWRKLMGNRLKQWFFQLNQGWVKLNRKF
jgi:hypothetical protein